MKTKLSYNVSNQMGHIVTRKTLKDLIFDIKKSTDKVVFTHGAFDILHIGHIEFLRKSKEKGQVLVVGVDSDKRIYTYKGIKRPIIPLDHRLRIISKFEYVDFVMPLTELDLSDDYFTKLYDDLAPNLVTFGKNFFAEKDLVERQKYLSNIKFKKIIHDYSDIQSTTKIIDKIVDSYN